MWQGLRLPVVALALVLAAQAATLEYLPTEDLIARSTAIVRGQVTASAAIQRGPVIYTEFVIKYSERLKGPAAEQVTVAVPGGVFQGRRQTYAGAPALQIGKEYVLFLWTGPSGMTQVIGLSQGVFSLSRESNGEVWAGRAASSEVMLDARTGRAVSDRPVRMALTELRSRVARAAQQTGVTQ